MILDPAMPLMGPIVLAVNITTMFLCMRPKRSKRFTICVLVAFTLAFHPLTMLLINVKPFIVRVLGILYLPLMLSLFKGETFQKVFAVMMPYQLGALPTHIADAITGITIGDESPYAITMCVAISIALLGAYMWLILRFGRRLLERMFAGGRRAEWALYSFGAILSWALILTLDWTLVGPWLYFSLIFFILWSVGVLCFTIINTHEKAAQVHHAETLILQMNAMRDQTDAEKKHKDDMEILRHDMRHEMGVIMELFRTGKGREAEAVYSGWQSAMAGAAHETLCAEPVLNAVLTRFLRKARDKNIQLYINSDIPDTLPIDTIKLSVIVSNALENALAATDKIIEQDKRVIRVKLIRHNTHIGLEVVNPCVSKVEFDEKGIPITHEVGHGIGVRSIAAFAKDNGYLLDFSVIDGRFTLRLVMEPVN